MIKPLTVMSIQELETILPHTQAGDVTWSDILDQRIVNRDEVAWISVHQAIYNLLKDRKEIPIRRNEFLKKEYDTIWQDIKKRYGWTTAQDNEQ